MKLSISIKVDALTKELATRISDNISRTIKTQMPIARDGVVKRTLAGRSYTGERFAAYSPIYANYKKRIGAGGRIPNLQLSGEMLRSMVTTSGRNFGLIEITGSFNRNKAFWNQGGNSSIPERSFMGLDSTQIDELLEQINNHILD